MNIRYKHIRILISLFLFFNSFQYSIIGQQKIIAKEVINDSHKDLKEEFHSKILDIKRYMGLGQYQKAYDLIKNINPKIKQQEFINYRVELLYQQLGLYLIFEQIEKANTVFHSNYESIVKDINEHQDKIQLNNKLNSMHSWLESRGNNNLIKAEEILIKSINYIKQNGLENSLSFLYTQLGLADCYILMYKFEQAKSILLDIKEKITDPNDHINCLLNRSLGNLFFKTKNYENAILYYEKSLQQINSQKIHVDIKVELLEHLAELYHKREMLKKAYSYLLESKSMNDSLFGSRSIQNKVLFEIRDKNAKQIAEQELIILKSKKDVWFLKSVMYISSLVLLIIGILIYFFRKVKKQKIEKEFLEDEKRAEHIRQKKELELKNKELLSSALQLMERENLQEDIKEQLNKIEFKEANTPIIKKIIRSLKIDRSKKWQEFDMHFTALNHSFFKVLKNEFPLLTKTDLKICAFVKLGFSSKDMSQIMGIGVEGINTSRSRIRKKMNLERSVVLVDFLQKIKEH